MGKITQEEICGWIRDRIDRHTLEIVRGIGPFGGTTFTTIPPHVREHMYANNLLLGSLRRREKNER